MVHTFRTAATAAIVACSAAAVPFAASAQSVKEFYQGKTVSMKVGFNPGGGYDTYARLVAQHWGKHIPGKPNIVVQNMPGAGSRNAANYLANKSPKDGSEIGMISGAVAVDPLIGGVPVRFDARKFTWLGSPTVDTGICLSWHESPVKTLEDVKKTEAVTGAARGTTLSYPLILNTIVGTKFKIIRGYRGAAGLMKAIQTGEIHAFCGNMYATILTRQPQWFKEDQAHILVQIALKKHPDLPDIPLIMDLAKDESQKNVLELLVGSQSSLGRPILAPPGVPSERTDALRQAFNEAMKDEQLLARAAKARLDITPVTGQEIQEFLAKVYELPKEVVHQAYVLLERDKAKKKKKKQ